MIANTIVNESNQQMFFVSPLGVSIMGNTKVYKTYSDLMHESSPPSFAWVLDATGDPTVSVGAAFYVNRSTHWQKLYESEAMDNENFGRPEGYDQLVQTVDGLAIRVESLANNKDLEDHIKNNLVHVSEEEREYWNKKLDPIEGKGLSTEDYTSEEKTKLSNLENYDDSEIKSSIAHLDETKAETTTVLELQNRVGVFEEETRTTLNDQNDHIQSATTAANVANTKANDAQLAVSEVSSKVNKNTQDIADLKSWKDNQVPTKNYDTEIAELKDFDQQIFQSASALAQKHVDDIKMVLVQVGESNDRIQALEQELSGISSTVSEIESMVGS